jgi:hypothetical protein
MNLRKTWHSIFVALTLVIAMGISSNPVAAQESEVVEYITIDQEIVDKATAIGSEIDQYVLTNEEGYLNIDPVVKDIYGEELYKFFVYGAYMNNERIANDELVATDSGLTKQNSGFSIMSDGGCSWSNFGKSLVGGAVSGGVSGAVGGAFVGGVGALPGAGVGAIGGIAGGGAVHFTTCWW